MTRVTFLLVGVGGLLALTFVLTLRILLDLAGFFLGLNEFFLWMLFESLGIKLLYVLILTG
jgi:hypothetical protein